ncbi:hypothetical protein BJ944DRAFT_45363 [Cunninghamella echinulata]|nr:hypothetical protein BJ944DRAFT_45363 [Cunninghamella echinulata]
MIFDRYRKPKRIEEASTTKKTSLADTLLRKLPISFTRRTKSKATLITTDYVNDKLPRHSASLPNINLDSNIKVPLDTPISADSTSIHPQKKALQSRPSLIFEDILIKKRHTIQPIERKKIATLLNSLDSKEEEKVENNEENNQEKQNNTMDYHQQQRHSFTFGHKKAKDIKSTISLNDLLLDASQVKKLDLFLAQRSFSSSSSSSSSSNIDNRDHSPPPKMIPPVPTLVIPQRSISHQIVSPPKKTLIRAHSTSSSSTLQQQQTEEYHHSPLDAIELQHMLENDQDHHLILIDVRNLVDYQKQRIHSSLNVNLPSLLIKRYQRGTVSNFHLENFITTAEGRDQYLYYKQSLSSSTAATNNDNDNDNDPSSSSTNSTSSSNTNSSSSSDETLLSSSPSSIMMTCPITPMTSNESTSTNSSVLQQKAQLQLQQEQKNNEVKDEKKKMETIWIVYDDVMDENHKVTQAWTLLNVLCKATKGTTDRVHYLKNGFQGFIQQQQEKWLEGTCHGINHYENGSSSSLTTASASLSAHGFNKKKKNKQPLTISTSTSTDNRTSGSSSSQNKKNVFPRRSLSYTVGDGSKVLQQTSLFSLDTQAARENNAHALARRASRKSQQQLASLQLNNSLSSSSSGMLPPPTPTIKSTFSKMNNNNHNHNQNHNNNSDSSKNEKLGILKNNNSNQQQQNKYNTTLLSSSTLSIPSSSTSLSSTNSYLNTTASSSTSLPLSPLSSSFNTPNITNISITSATAPTITSSSSSSLINNTPDTTIHQLSQVLEEEIDEDEDEVFGQMTTDTSPRTDSDFEFIISEIIPNFLYVGPEIETKDQAEQLLTRPIRRILNMAEECHDHALLEYQHNLLYRKIAAQDTVEMKNIDHIIMEAVGFIEEAKKNHEAIYVHCKAGKSRSVTAILAYLVTCEKWTLKRSYRHIIKARPNMSPNIGFIAELMKLENQVHGRVSSFLETDWQTAALPSPDFTKELKQLQHAWSHSPSTPTIPNTSFSTITH